MRVLAIPARNVCEEARLPGTDEFVSFAVVGGKTVLEHQLDMAGEWGFPEVVISVLPEDEKHIRELVGDTAMVEARLGVQEKDGIGLSMASCLYPLANLPEKTQVTFLSPGVVFHPCPPNGMLASERRPAPGSQRHIDVGTATVVYVRGGGEFIVDAIAGQMIGSFARRGMEDGPALVLAGTFTQALSTWRTGLRRTAEDPGFEFLERFEATSGVVEQAFVVAQIPREAWFDLTVEGQKAGLEAALKA